MIYFDAAYISKCYLNEPGSEKVMELASGSEGLCSSEYGRLEFFSVLHRYLREGKLTRPQITRALEYLVKDEEENVWHWIPVTSSLIRTVCDNVHTLSKEVFVRAGDALHLSSAKAHGFTEVYTNDRRMLGAARHFGIVARNVIQTEE